MKKQLSKRSERETGPWEHGTFMVPTLLTYDLWYRTDQFVEAQERSEAQ